MVLGLINMVLTTMRQDFNIMQTADDAAAAPVEDMSALA